MTPDNDTGRVSDATPASADQHRPAPPDNDTGKVCLPERFRALIGEALTVPTTSDNAQARGSNWECVCGVTSLSSEGHCSWCGRERPTGPDVVGAPATVRTQFEIGRTYATADGVQAKVLAIEPSWNAGRLNDAATCLTCELTAGPDNAHARIGERAQWNLSGRYWNGPHIGDNDDLLPTPVYDPVRDGPSGLDIDPYGRTNWAPVTGNSQLDHPDLIHAVADGRTIQYRAGGQWHDLSGRAALHFLARYDPIDGDVRIKPEPIVRYLGVAENGDLGMSSECSAAALHYFQRDRDEHPAYIVRLEFDPDNVCACTAVVTPT
jgi:hypothetical protein